MTGLRVIFIGPPGVGKGTQAALLAERAGVPHVSTGDMFRRAIRERTPMGRRAQPHVESGGYVPDEIVNGIVAERLAAEDCASGFVLDGFPRTEGQAEALDRILRETDKRLDAVIFLVVPDDEVVRRLTGRRVCDACAAVYHVRFAPPRVEGICDACGGELVQRSDDTEETVRKRVSVYRDRTSPVVGYYRRHGTLVKVDGDGVVEDVAARVAGALAPGIRS